VKYIAIVDDDFLSNFRLDDEDKLTLVLTDENNGTRALRLKPVIRPTLTLEDGQSFYITEGHIQAMREYEKNATMKRIVDEINDNFGRNL
jgi:hypothetical protein